MVRMSRAAARPAGRLPARLVQRPLDLVVRRALSRRPGLLARLGWEEERTVLIAPDDLPFAFLVRCSIGRVRIEAVPPGRLPEADAFIRGPLPDLFDLVTGGGDGDAQFFARTLRFAGDTELVVALRNAIDDAELDPLADLLPLPAALVPIARRGIARLARMTRMASEDLGRLHRLLLQLAPIHEGEVR